MSKSVAKQRSKDWLSQLPVEVSVVSTNENLCQIAEHILYYVDGRGLLAIACVSRWWRALVADERMWLALCRRMHIDDDNASAFTQLPTIASLPAGVCPSKAVYMRHRRVVLNWRTMPVTMDTLPHTPIGVQSMDIHCL